MSRPTHLSFYCRGTAQVPDPVALMTRGINRCVGRAWQQVAPPVGGDGPNAHPGTWTWIPTGKPDPVAYDFDLINAAKAGDLWPADAETAKACGLPFDPDCGNEPFQTIRDFKAGLPGLSLKERREAEEAETAKAKGRSVEQAAAKAEADAAAASAEAARKLTETNARPTVEGTSAGEDDEDHATADDVGGKGDD